MAQQCLKWTDTIFKWSEANFTWKEACVIEEIVTKIYGGSGPLNRNKKLSKHIKNLPKEDRQVLINVITRIKTDFNNEMVIKSSKTKNKKVKVKIDDMKLFIKEIKGINVKVII
jgi:hypothetical protein